ncbi:hypothetical protein [Litorisediminicola beolgyonensis]|uniref:Uncharacterized protein n=1 Tax=Litorisediminicola beolgyonensis TaxID=1173614 RepID=A0ABW3ZNU5_9RHOB
MDAQVCTPPSIIPSFDRLVLGDAPVTIYAALDTDPPQACSSSLTGQAATDCASFTTWTQYTAAFAGVLGTAANLVYKFVPNKKLASEIVTGLHAIYSGVQGVNQQFLLAIQDINAGKPYAPVPQPDPIPPFPTPTKGNDIGQAVEQAWLIFKPFLEKAIAKMPTGSPWIKVLEGIITASDKIIEQLKALFNQIAG